MVSPSLLLGFLFLLKISIKKQHRRDSVLFLSGFQFSIDDQPLAVIPCRVVKVTGTGNEIKRACISVGRHPMGIFFLYDNKGFLFTFFIFSCFSSVWVVAFSSPVEFELIPAEHAEMGNSTSTSSTTLIVYIM
jgi:hypothetical protein